MGVTSYKLCFINFPKFKRLRFFNPFGLQASFFFNDFKFWFQSFGLFTRYTSYMNCLKFFYETLTLGAVANTFFIIRFYMKGIGYKFLRPKKNKGLLRVELGYSVSNYVKIPKFVKVINKRDKVAIFGFDKFFVIDFSKRIYSLRPADVYRGKGVRISSIEYKKFKPGKQRLIYNYK